jgi:hypothetical protein
MAGGLTTHLGLHIVALQNVAGISPSDKESRIRTFWQGFRVDRYKLSTYFIKYG